MAQNDITLKIDADTAKGIRSLAQFANGQKQIEYQTQRATRSARSMNAGFSKTLGLLAGFTSAGAIFGGIVRDVEKYQQRAAGFEKEITPLLSLGDNVQNIRSVKQEVISLSNALGRPTQEVADFLFRIQSGSANLSNEIQQNLKREAIELSRVTGEDLATSLQVINKAFQIYGDELQTVDRAQNKLFVTAEKGNMTFQDLATLMPDVIPAARAMGFSFDDVAGALITATQTGGKSEKTFTGIRNVFLRLSEAQEKGVKLTGSFIEQMEKLSQVKGTKLKEIFGAEAISVAASLAQHSKELRENIEAMSAMDGDIVQSRLAARLGDPAFMRAEQLGRMAQLEENISLNGQSSGAQSASDKFRMAKIGWKSVAPDFLHWVAPIAAGSSLIAESIGLPTRDKRGVPTGYLALGQDKLLESMARGGQDTDAAASLLRSGQLSYPGGVEGYLADLQASLKENTEATKENTRVAGGGKSLPSNRGASISE